MLQMVMLFSFPADDLNSMRYWSFTRTDSSPALKFKSPSAEPVKSENMEAFKKNVDSLMVVLKEH